MPPLNQQHPIMQAIISEFKKEFNDQRKLWKSKEVKEEWDDLAKRRRKKFLGVCDLILAQKSHDILECIRHCTYPENETVFLRKFYLPVFLLRLIDVTDPLSLLEEEVKSDQHLPMQVMKGHFLDIFLHMKDHWMEHVTSSMIEMLNYAIAVGYYFQDELDLAKTYADECWDFLRANKSLFLRETYGRRSIRVSYLLHKIDKTPNRTKIEPPVVERERWLLLQNGRHVPKSQLPRDTTIYRESFSVGCPKIEWYQQFGTICDRCMIVVTYPLPCPDCCMVSFCSVRCKNLALDGYHKLECVQPILSMTTPFLELSQGITTERLHLATAVLLLRTRGDALAAVQRDWNRALDPKKCIFSYERFPDVAWNFAIRAATIYCMIMLRTKRMQPSVLNDTFIMDLIHRVMSFMHHTLLLETHLRPLLLPLPSIEMLSVAPNVNLFVENHNFVTLKTIKRVSPREILKMGKILPHLEIMINA